MNYMIKPRFGFYFIIFLTLFFYFLAVSYVFAFQVEGFASIVPSCATSIICIQSDNTPKQVTDVCGICDIFALIQNVLNFIIKDITIPLAALFLAYGGVLMILPYIGGSTAMHDKGKKVILQALTGILIIFFAWLGIDTIIKVIASPVITNPSEPGQIFVDYGYFPWNEFKCANSKTATGKPPPCEPKPPPGPGNNDKTTTEDTLKWQLSQPPEGTSLKGPGASSTCDASGLVLYEDTIKNEATANGLKPNRVKAIILTESGGSVRAKSNDNDGKHSYGIMQVRPETARDLHRPFANLTDKEIGKELQDNPTLSLKLGTKYYGDQFKAGRNHNLAAAQYNGGPAANHPSVNCAGATSPNGGTMRRWECPWDNNAHTVPNTRYQVTRDYIPKVNSYEALLDAGHCP